MLRIIIVLLLAGLTAPIAFAQPPEPKAVGMAAFTAGNYQQAVVYLKKATSKNKLDAEAWSVLGTAYFRLGKSKNAMKAMEKAVALDPKNEIAAGNLAMLYSARRDKRAEAAARNVLAINKNNAAGNYVLGVFYYRAENWRAAYDHAMTATRIDPKFAAAWMLMSRSLVATFFDIRTKAVSGAARAEVMRNAVDALTKFTALSSGPRESAVEDELKDLQFFAEYYSRPENNLQLGEKGPEDGPSVTKTPFKILAKPLPGYTDDARMHGVAGTILLLVGFDASGKVGPIVVLKSLDPGLDARAIRAARGITFEPPTKNGVPYSVVKHIEYTFSIY